MSFESSNLTFPEQYNAELERLLLPYSVKMSHPAKHTFSVPGDELNCIYYIKEGRTKHYMMNDDGTEKILYTLTPGWFFGEIGWFLGYSTGLYSQTELPSVLYRVDGDACRRLLNQDEMFRDTLIRGYCHKLLVMRYEIENLTFNSCKNRIKRLLASSVDLKNVTDPGWYDLKVKYTHYELGVIVGSARVTVSKLMNELCNEGFIRVINRRVQVNAEKYRAYIGSTREERDV